jgi:hypothetical protein
MEIKIKLRRLREKAYKLDGSYEDNYNFLINELDKIIQ